MQWYYALNGQRLGPVSQDDFTKLVADGTIKGDTLVWTQGMPEWRAYSSVATPAADDGTELCAVSGQRFPRSQMINHGGKWISAEHRDAYFQRLREGVVQPLVGEPAVPGPFGYGGFWLRVGAALIDLVINLVVGFFMGALLGRIFVATGAVYAPGGGLALGVMGNGVGLGIGLGYQIYFIRKFDATPGKLAVGLKIVRSDGSKLSVGRIVGRHFAHFLSALPLCIGYIVIALDDRKRGFHDRICDTNVVRTR